MTTNHDNAVNTPAVGVDAVFTALEKWINQRPGLEFGNYGAVAPYRAELRSIANDKKRALKALDEARALQPARPELLLEAFKRAYSGRLEWVVDANVSTGHGTVGNPYVPVDMKRTGQIGHLEYTTGQYWPTEYRKAAASVLETYISSWKQVFAAENPKVFTYRNMDDVIHANQSIGCHWFDRDTVRFFKCKIESGAVPLYSANCTKARFISSEKRGDEPRRYTIREAQPDGSIRTVGEFQGYGSRDAARKDLLKDFGA